MPEEAPAPAPAPAEEASAPAEAAEVQDLALFTVNIQLPGGNSSVQMKVMSISCDLAESSGVDRAYRHSIGCPPIPE